MREKIESLTQEQFLPFLDGRITPPRVKPSVAAHFLESSLAKLGLGAEKQEQLPSQKLVSNQLLRGFSKAVLETDKTINYRLANANSRLSQSLGILWRTCYADPMARKPGQISSAEMLEFGEWLELNSLRLGPKNYVVALELMMEPFVFGSNSPQGLREFLLSVIRHEDSIDIMEALVDLALNYEGELPTAKQWAEGLRTGLIAFGDGELLASSAGMTKFTGYGNKQQKTLKRSILDSLAAVIPWNHDCEPSQDCPA